MHIIWRIHMQMHMGHLHAGKFIITLRISEGNLFGAFYAHFSAYDSLTGFVSHFALNGSRRSILGS